MTKRISLAVVGVCLLVGFQSVSIAADALPGSGGPGQQGIDVGGVVPDYVPGRLLVKFKPGVGAAKRKAVIASQKGQEARCIPGIDVRIIELPAHANEKACMAAFRGRREVEFAELDPIVQSALAPNDPWYDDPYNGQWHLPKIECPAAWNITTGSSEIVIAIIDTGVNGAHEDLRTQMVPGWNVRSNSSDTSPVHRHGTAVAGVAAASSNNGTGVASPAWNCAIMPIVASDALGYTSSIYLAESLVWAADHGARVANMSFAMMSSDTLTAGARYFQDTAGGIVTMGAGNTGHVDADPNCPYYLGVSATDQDDLVPSWSITGNGVDLSAPGVMIMTTSVEGAYTSSTGTSSSAPIVAGVAALVLSVNPDLTGPQVEDILKQSADDFGPNGWDPSYGWGRINAGQAVEMAVSYGGGPPADTTPPDVRFVEPTQSETVTGLIDVTMTATDDTRVSSVTLDIDGVEMGTDTSAPYSFAWDTTEADNASHTLTATAVDSAGNEAWAQVTVVVDNPVLDTAPPSVNMTSPSDNSTVSDTITLQAIASDNIGVASVAFRADGELVGTDNSAPYSASWDTSGLPNGTCVLTATALDAAGNAADASATVTIDNVVPDAGPPAVAVTNPADGSTVSGIVTVQISASDDTGVAWVSLSVDGVSLGADTTAPYSFSWYTETSPNGPCVLVATAADAAGNITEDSITVTVSNTVPDTEPPTVSVDAPAAGSTVSGIVTVQISAEDDSAVASVSLSVNGTLLATDIMAPYSFIWDTETAADGTCTLVATAVDTAGNVSEDSTWVTVDNSVVGDTTPPTISIKSPADGSIVTKPTVVQVSASDDVGVTKVELYVDGKLTSSSTDAPVFKMRLNPKKLSKDLHTLQCRAYDAAGNVGTSAAITIDTGGGDTSTASTDDVTINRKNK